MSGKNRKYTHVTMKTIAEKLGISVMALLGSTREEEVGDSGSVGLLNGIHDRFAETEYSVRTAPVAIGIDGQFRVQENRLARRQS